MNTYRKYFEENQLSNLSTQSPSWGIDILTIGHNVHRARNHYPDHNHPNQYFFNWNEGRVLNEFQLVYIANGQGIFESRTTAPTLVEGGTAFLLYPGVWHRFKPSGDTGWEEFWVGFRGHYADYLMRQECFDPHRPLISISFRLELLSVFTRLIDTLKYEGIAYQQIATCQIIQLLGLVYSSALSSHTSQNRRQQIVYEVRYQVHGNWERSIDFKELAKERNVSYVWLRKAFKDVMGVAPGQYHLKIKIEKAAQMLQETDLTITEIAHRTGFESLFHFSRIFRKKTGFPPSQYRAKKL